MFICLFQWYILGSNLTIAREDNGMRRRHHTWRQQRQKCEKYETCNFSPQLISKTVQLLFILVLVPFLEKLNLASKTKSSGNFPRKVSNFCFEISSGNGRQFKKKTLNSPIYQVITYIIYI